MVIYTVFLICSARECRFTGRWMVNGILVVLLGMMRSLTGITYASCKICLDVSISSIIQTKIFVLVSFPGFITFHSVLRIF